LLIPSTALLKYYKDFAKRFKTLRNEIVKHLPRKFWNAFNIFIWRIV